MQTSLQHIHEQSQKCIFTLTTLGWFLEHVLLAATADFHVVTTPFLKGSAGLTPTWKAQVLFLFFYRKLPLIAVAKSSQNFHWHLHVTALRFSLRLQVAKCLLAGKNTAGCLSSDWLAGLSQQCRCSSRVSFTNVEGWTLPQRAAAVDGCELKGKHTHGNRTKDGLKLV